MTPRGNTPTRLGGQRSELDDAENLLARSLGENFELLGLIGAGGMGQVYKAHNKQLDQFVAVKIVRDTANGEKQSIQRLQKEAKALAALDHENIVKVHFLQLIQDRDCALIMEYVTGKDLAAVIAEEGRLAPIRCRSILLQCARAIAHAHSRGVVHRDIKPNNILLTQSADGQEQVRILDFGIAKLMDTGQQRLTRTGSIMGSPAYMSPEQCSGSSVDGRSDLYSLGCVMYEALMGKPPFSGDTPFEVLLKHSNEPAPPVVSGDAFLSDIVAQCLEKHPDDRFQSADELVEALEADGYRRRASTHRLPIVKKRLPKWVIPTLVGTLVALAIGFATFSLSRTDAPGPQDSPRLNSWRRLVDEFRRIPAGEPVPASLTANLDDFAADIQSPEHWKAIGNSYFDYWRMSKDPQSGDRAIVAYKRSIDLYHQSREPKASKYELPKMVLILLEKDVNAAEKAVIDELEFARSHDNRVWQLKSYLDLMALHALSRNASKYQLARKELFKQFPLDDINNVLYDYSAKADDWLLNTAIKEYPDLFKFGKRDSSKSGG